MAVVFLLLLSFFVAQSEFLNSTELSEESRLVTLRSRNERFLKIPPPALRAQIPPKQRVGPLRIISATLHNPRQIVLMLRLQHRYPAFSDYATRSGSRRRNFMRATLPPPRPRLRIPCPASSRRRGRRRAPLRQHSGLSGRRASGI